MHESNVSRKKLDVLAFHIQQLRRAFGILITSCNAALKLNRLRFVGTSPEAAKRNARFTNDSSARSQRRMDSLPDWYIRNLYNDAIFQAFYDFTSRRGVG